MTVECKYCDTEDKIDNFHEDKFTKEHYHEDCRPSRPKKGKRKNA